MASKPGRKRKSTAKRHPGGQLVHQPRETLAERAASMPHRKGLGAKALDQRAESALGRLALAGRISDNQLLAGQKFAQEWGAYLATIGPPAQLGGRGEAYDCGGCLDQAGTQFCICDQRRVAYMASLTALAVAGPQAIEIVVWIVLRDRPTLLHLSGDMLDLDNLALGLDALASHYGLTNHRKRNYVNAKSHITAT